MCGYSCVGQMLSFLWYHNSVTGFIVIQQQSVFLFYSPFLADTHERWNNSHIIEGYCVTLSYSIAFSAAASTGDFLQRQANGQIDDGETDNGQEMEGKKLTNLKQNPVSSFLWDSEDQLNQEQIPKDYN